MSKPATNQQSRFVLTYQKGEDILESNFDTWRELLLALHAHDPSGEGQNGTLVSITDNEDGQTLVVSGDSWDK